tara:strand:- start:987 stop:1841 length:855 start_codon:yes stop_codon:yes gene_type:complete
MQYVKLIGGLGNQLFQYAFADFLLRKNKKVKLDKFCFDSYILHKCSIQKFNCKIRFASWNEVSKYYLLKNITFSNKLNFFSNKLYSMLSSIFIKGYISENHIKEKKYNNYTYFDGFWQNLNYFSTNRNSLIKIFKIKKVSKSHHKLIDKIKKDKKSVAIHIRVYSGKYSKFHGNLGKSYYTKAINKINSEINKPFFYIFSNNQDAIEKKINLKEINYKIIKKFKDFEDIISISTCRHQIISNSTFSWWGAWLNQNKNKIVIVPKKWILSNPQPKNLIPYSWFKF